MMSLWKELSMKTPFTALCMAAALLAAPAQAAQRIDDTPSEAVSASQRGVVQKGSSATVLRINGRSYTISSATVVFNGGGQRVALPRVTEGQTVGFNLVSGSTSQIKELWIDL
jgi:hypothetical protein